MSSMPQIWVGTSWKMNKDLAEAQAFADGLISDAANTDPRIQRFVIPPFTAVRQVKAMLTDTDVKVGAQNMHWAENGAWTGEISAAMLKDCNLNMVELGHSERRAHFGETDESVGRKVAAAIRYDLIPIICVGETRAERDAGRAEEILAGQVRGAVKYLAGSAKSATLLFAYEPVWAIGETGIPATPDYADQQHSLIKQHAEAALGGHQTPCLYGGSVNPGNCKELISCPHIDGLFIGRAAWDVQGYIGILNDCAAVISNHP